LVLAITTALSSLTYLAIERPALLLKSKPNGSRALPSTRLLLAERK
jgi:hypothetical protein